MANFAAEMREWDNEEIVQLEIELAKQTERLAAAEQKLATKSTRTAANEQRVAGNKIEQIKRRIADLKRTNLEDRDSRMFPGYYCPVLVSEAGKLVVKPTRRGRSRISLASRPSPVSQSRRSLLPATTERSSTSSPSTLRLGSTRTQPTCRRYTRFSMTSGIRSTSTGSLPSKAPGTGCGGGAMLAASPWVWGRGKPHCNQPSEQACFRRTMVTMLPPEPPQLM